MRSPPATIAPWASSNAPNQNCAISSAVAPSRAAFLAHCRAGVNRGTASVVMYLCLRSNTAL
eukprot:1655232-Lingulodinium_polyedra.AAC.1